jgi:Amt family ammonium transporter
LAGLVGITAGCAYVSDGVAILIGAVCGIAMVFATEFLESKRIDDPVGAFAVHGVSGSIGTLAVGLFAIPELTAKFGFDSAGLFYGGGWSLLGIQALGLVVVCTWGFGLTWIALKIIKLVVPVRVTKDEELIGLDVGIHGVPAYSQENDFIELKQMMDTK